MCFLIAVCLNHSLARKSVRQSTSEHTRKTNLRLQERQDAPRRRRGAHRDRPLTQEELLAEAKITAEINIRSLGKNVSIERMLLSKFSVFSRMLYDCNNRKLITVMYANLINVRILQITVSTHQKAS